MHDESMPRGFTAQLNLSIIVSFAALLFFIFITGTRVMTVIMVNFFLSGGNVSFDHCATILNHIPLTIKVLDCLYEVIFKAFSYFSSITHTPNFLPSKRKVSLTDNRQMLRK